MLRRNRTVSNTERNESNESKKLFTAHQLVYVNYVTLRDFTFITVTIFTSNIGSCCDVSLNAENIIRPKRIKMQRKEEKEHCSK